MLPPATTMFNCLQSVCSKGLTRTSPTVIWIIYVPTAQAVPISSHHSKEPISDSHSCVSGFVLIILVLIWFALLKFRQNNINLLLYNINFTNFLVTLGFFSVDVNHKFNYQPPLTLPRVTIPTTANL